MPPGPTGLIEAGFVDVAMPPELVKSIGGQDVGADARLLVLSPDSVERTVGFDLVEDEASGALINVGGDKSLRAAHADAVQIWAFGVPDNMTVRVAADRDVHGPPVFGTVQIRPRDRIPSTDFGRRRGGDKPQKCEQREVCCSQGPPFESQRWCSVPKQKSPLHPCLQTRLGCPITWGQGACSGLSLPTRQIAPDFSPTWIQP